jgi:uncharacterized membrane protein
MAIALWVITGLLAAVFLGAGLMKVTRPRTALVAAGQGWAEDIPDAGVTTIGTLEIAGAAGLVLPALLDTATVLVPLAALGLGVLMLGAAATHLRRREWQKIAPPLVLAALAFFVAVQRFGPHAF